MNINKANPEWFKRSHSNPFNWVGSKHRYLIEFYSKLPNKEGLKVLDPFVGGGDLISKLPTCWDIHANDYMKEVVDLHKGVQSKIITADKVSAEYLKRGMSKGNREAYLSLREEYNENKDTFLLYLLMTNSFNNQLRFNNSGGFNMPFGKDRSSFSTNMKNKLINYSSSLEERKVTFKNENVFNLDFTEYDLLLLDPPYSNTCATYNENTGWNEGTDKALFSKIDDCGKDFIYFNQTWSKGVENKSLVSWMRKYSVTTLKETSKGCNHHRKNGYTEEVLITNL